MLACQQCKWLKNIIPLGIYHFHIPLATHVLPVRRYKVKTKHQSRTTVCLHDNKEEISRCDISRGIIMIVLAVVTDAASFMCKYRERNSGDVTRLPPQQHFQPGDTQRWRAVEAVGD